MTVAHREQIALGVACRTAAGLGWVSMSGLVKWATGQGATIVQLLFFRYLVALLLISGFILATAGAGSLRTSRPFTHMRRAGIGLASILLIFLSVAVMPLTEATAIGFAAPLFVVVLSAPVLKERVPLYQWAAVGVGFLGVLVMLRPDPAHLANVGALAALAGALATAGSTLTVRDLGRTERGPTIVFYMLLFGCIACALPLPFYWSPPSPGVWAALVALGAISAVTQLLLTQAVRLAPAAVVAPFDYSQLVWAALIGWLIWDERLRAATLLGGLIVAGSGLYILWTEVRRRRAA